MNYQLIIKSLNNNIMTTFYVLFNGHFHFITSDVLNLNNFNHHTKKADIKFVSKDADECVERCELLNSKIKKS